MTQLQTTRDDLDDLFGPAPDRDISTKPCAQCKQVSVDRDEHFCSEECQVNYWKDVGDVHIDHRPVRPLEDIQNRLAQMAERVRDACPEVILKNGHKVRIIADSQEHCARCGAKVWLAFTDHRPDKRSKVTQVDDLGDGFDSHHATCGRTIQKQF